MKKACVIRYGGFGDMIQISSVLPGLKAQGYHVTVNTYQSGKDLLKHDPHVDDFIIQVKDEIPNEKLGEYWAGFEEKFDKVINYSESVEGSLLALQGRAPYAWPHDARHKYMNHNYLEMTHLIAGVPLPPKQEFYPSRNEKRWRDKFKKKHGRFVLWTLAGSSVHKAWPHMDTIIARILLQYPDLKIVLTGDTLCQMLEIGWENEKRVICTSGKWSIRKTLALAQAADLVIGPETGVLNVVGIMDIPKIIFLSHSSEENLTKLWDNVYPMTPENCPCYPCHKMHYGFDTCKRDESTGGSLCAANVSPEEVWMCIRKVFG